MKHRDGAVSRGMNRLYEFLVGRISGGELRAGDRLPGERELALAFDINRMAVKEVLNRLVREFLVSRVQGRGTFVNRRMSVGAVISLDSGELRLARSSGDAVRVEVIGYGVASACGDLTALAEAPGRPIPAMVRLLIDGERPLAVERAFLHSGYAFKGIEVLKAEPNLERCLWEAGVRTETSGGRVELVHADSCIAALLSLGEDAPVYSIRRWYRGSLGNELACVEQIVRVDGVTLAATGLRG